MNKAQILFSETIVAPTCDNPDSSSFTMEAFPQLMKLLKSGHTVSKEPFITGFFNEGKFQLNIFVVLSKPSNGYLP